MCILQHKNRTPGSLFQQDSSTHEACKGRGHTPTTSRQTTLPTWNTQREQAWGVGHRPHEWLPWPAKAATSNTNNQPPGPGSRRHPSGPEDSQQCVKWRHGQLPQKGRRCSILCAVVVINTNSQKTSVSRQAPGCQLVAGSSSVKPPVGMLWTPPLSTFKCVYEPQTATLQLQRAYRPLLGRTKPCKSKTTPLYSLLMGPKSMKRAQGPTTRLYKAEHVYIQGCTRLSMSIYIYVYIGQRLLQTPPLTNSSHPPHAPNSSIRMFSL